MFLEYEHTTTRHSWPASMDMTQSDTYPVHVNFELTQAEKEARVVQTVLTTELQLIGVAA